jgi:hypothetical protein
MSVFQSQILGWGIWLLTAACGVVFIIKFRGTRPGLLGAIGFGILVILPLFYQIAAALGLAYWDYSFFFDFIRIAAWVLLLIAFINIPGIVGQKAWYRPQTMSSIGNNPELVSAGFQPTAYPTADTQSYGQPIPSDQRFISKGLFIGSFIGGAGASIFFTVMAMSFMVGYGSDDAIPLWILAILTMIFAAIMLCVLIHRLWTAIQPGHPRATPGKAVGFMFIPFFNLYWVFQVYHGWAQDYNRYVREAGIPAPPVSESLGLTVAILVLAACIPYVGILPGLANLVCIGIFLSQAVDGANAIIKYTLN